jgi:hypothetical protein
MDIHIHTYIHTYIYILAQGVSKIHGIFSGMISSYADNKNSL